MSVGFCRRLPSLSTPDINEASNKDITASLHKNVLSWGVCQEQEEKESLSQGALTLSAHSRTAESGSCSGVSNLFRTASVPDVVGRRPNFAFSSITIQARKAVHSLSSSKDLVLSSVPTQHVKVSPKVPETLRRGALSIPVSAMHVSDINLSSQSSYRSCIHHEVPLRSNRSILFWDKSFSISLVDLERRQEGQPSLFTSTLSFRFGVSSCSRSSSDNKSTKTNGSYWRAKAAMLDTNKHNDRGRSLGHCRGLLIKQQDCKVKQTAPACSVNSKTDDPDTRQHSVTLGLLSFRGPNPSNSKARRLKGNADEAPSPTRGNFRHRQHTFNSGTVDCRTWSKLAGSDKTQEQGEQFAESRKLSALDETCYYHSLLKTQSVEGTSKILSLKEALELFRPDFISRSQTRVRRLEQRARRRRALQDSNPDLVQALREDAGRQRRKCTTPDPLSDNLFKPRERSISGREMQLRSRRIYNKLPEVTKKKEEEKKRAVSQTNRLRAEVFKKRLLDQILQR